MKKYEVQINGRNFLMAMEGKPSRGTVGIVELSPLTDKGTPTPRKFGFYTNVFVEAASPSEAEEKAVAMLRKDRKLTRAVLNGADDGPRLYAESITEITSFRGCHLPRTGLGFYLERQKKTKTIPTPPRTLRRVPRRK